MARLTALSLEDAAALGRSYGIAVDRAEPLDAGSVNSNFTFFAANGVRLFGRIYEEQPRAGAQRELGLLRMLAQAGVPVACPLGASDGEVVLEYRGKPFALFPWVPGEWLCLERVTPAHCTALGEALARVHLASPLAVGLNEGRFRPEDMLERLGRVEREGDTRLRAATGYARDRYAHYLLRRDLSLPRGICHGDLFRDNVLWQGERLAALLDFESVALGGFAYDLMVTLLAWCYRDALVLPNARALVQGYRSVRELTRAELAALPVEAALGCLRFVTSRLTDFELRAKPGERPARDFQRFFSRLEAIEQGALGAVLTSEP